jgi:cbb3-type cytochrome oxidase subunit 3
MIFAKIMSDPGLCAVCVILLALWAWTYRAAPKTSFDAEKALMTLFRIFCGFLLVYSTRDKLLDPSHFMSEVDDYHFLPAQLVPLAAVVIPWIEFFSGAALMLGVWWPLPGPSCGGWISDAGAAWPTLRKKSPG